ncbi:endonuclease NucS [Dysgonomonas sp. Shenzhen-Wh21]|uniref:endonuclease NucS domain-containing protein n=1 Tax=Dysgonomonas TaxID=156973 RepID=UPI00208ED913|nr:endonuclease NucS domain-containing protein [Dysgonomonas mossii]
MSLYKISNEQLFEISSVQFQDFSYLEKHIQNLITKDPNVLGEDLLIISEEYTDWQESKKRLDLLALDRSGNLVVIEIKRDNDGFHMDLQAIRYASMLSLMTYDNVINTYSKYLEKQGKDGSGAQKGINDFLNYNEEKDFEFAKDIRIILVNNHYSKELTSSVLWLRKKGIDIKCIQFTPYKNEGDQDILLDINILIPLREANDYMIAIQKKEQEKEKVSQQIRSTRDYSKFKFNQEILSKNRLVLNVVKKYILDNPEKNIEEIRMAFPNDLQGSFGVVKTLEEYRNESLKGKRFFDDDNEIVYLSDKTPIVVCSQWGIGSITRFNNQAKELGYKIEKVDS